MMRFLRSFNTGPVWVVTVIALVVFHFLRTQITIGVEDDLLVEYQVCHPGIDHGVVGWFCATDDDPMDGPSGYEFLTAGSVDTTWFKEQLRDRLYGGWWSYPTEDHRKPQMVLVQADFVGQWTGKERTVVFLIPRKLLQHIDRLREPEKEKAPEGAP